MKNTPHDIGIASQIGKYSDAVETQTPGRMLFISGTPGLTKDGHLPDTFEGQADQAWANVVEMLEKASMTPEDLIKVSQYLIRAEDIPKYRPIRSKWLGENKPAFLLAVIPGLVREDFLIEIEAIAVAWGRQHWLRIATVSVPLLWLKITAEACRNAKR